MSGLVCNVSLQIIPQVPDADLYPLVDRVIGMIRDSGVKYVVGPMETTMEGELHALLGIVERAQDLCFQHGATRVLAVVKIDCKPGGATIDEKIARYR